MRGNKARHLSIIIAIAMFFTGAYFMMGQDASAVSKPKAPKNISVKEIKITTATVKWTKVKRNVKGYTVFRNGKAIKSVAPGVTQYIDTALKPASNNTYQVKAYNIAKKKRWYNKKTKKWQAKKPAKKYRGKSKIIKVKVYGKGSAKVSFTTFNDTWRVYGRTVKASQCPITFEVKSSKCPKCGVYGQKATVTYKKENWRVVLKGTDYSEECHHCNSIDLYGYCEKTKNHRFFTAEGEINSNGSINETETFLNHCLNAYHTDPASEAHEKGTRCNGMVGDKSKHFTNTKGRWIYCKDCKTNVGKPKDLPAGWPDHLK